MEKILFLTSSFPRFYNDYSGWFVYELCARLNQTSIVIAPHHSKIKLKSKINNINIYRFPYFFPFSLQKLAYGNGIPYNLKGSFLAKVQVPFFFISELVFTMFIVKYKKIGLINSHWLMSQGLIGAICKKLFSVKHIASIHSSEITLLKKVPCGKRIAQFIVNNSDSIVSVSSHRANELMSLLSPECVKRASDKIKIIPVGVNFSQDLTNDRDNLRHKHGVESRHLILFVGRLVEVKGCEYLIEAMKSVIDEVPNALLMIVGQGPLEADLKQKVKELSLEEYVRFEGFVDHSKVSDYYSMSDVFVFPSIVDSSGFEEGLPIALLEALFTGKAIVATKTKGVMEVIQNNHNGVLVEPKKSSQIANSLIELLTNDRLRYKLSDNASKSGLKYTLSSFADSYHELIMGV